MNPLTVLEKVFLHLSVEDLKQCRQVNKIWHLESTSVLRKSIASIPVGTSADLKTLLTIASQSIEIPFTKFNLSSHLFSSENCELTIEEFFTVCGPQLESISITLDKETSSFSQSLNSDSRFQKDFHFPKLKHITIIGHGLDNSRCTQNGSQIPIIFKILLCASSKIETLSIIMDNDCRKSVRSTLNYLFTRVQQNFKSLQSLKIYSPVEDNDILLLSKMHFRLKYLKCDFHRSCFLHQSLKLFLQAQSSSLEYLKFDNYYGNSCYTVDFPIMKNVKTLKIDGKSELSSKEVRFLQSFNYTVQFPSLKKLVLGGSIQLNKCWKTVFPENENVLSLKYLKLTATFIDPVWIKRIGSIFPNLDRLYFILTPNNEPLAEIIFKSLTNLKDLTISFHPSNDNLDHVLTGYNKEVCQQKRNNPELLFQFQGSLLQPHLERPSLTNLKYLKRLYLKGENPSGLQISDVTGLTLLQMPSLQNVKMHRFELSSEALQLLAKKLHLTLVD